MDLRRGRIHACAPIPRADACRGALHRCRGVPPRPRPRPRPSPRRSSTSASTSATTTSSPPTTSSSQYWQKIDKESTRMQVIEIGKTEEGRPHLAAIITAPENFAKLDRYKQIAQQLHRARGLTDAQARALAKEGKSVVWIDGGLHATEVVGAHQLIETVYQLVSRTDDETTRILRDVIVVAVHANPDGMQMVSKCYMQNAGADAAPHLQPAALQQVRGARQQPRLLHVEHEGIPEHEQAHVLGVAAADHVQPSPVRPGRHGDLLAALPRSVQLQLRSDDRDRPRHGRRRDAPSLPAGREARASRCVPARPIRRGGTAACARRRTSRTSSAC